MKKVLVAGATGYLGKYLVRELHSQGYWIRALSRKPGKLIDINEFIDDEFIGEVTKPNTLDGICDDIDFVITSIGITRQKDNLTYMDVDYQGNRNLLDQAVKGKVSKFIYVSVLNARRMKDLKPIQAKLKFEEELTKADISYSIVRPNGYFSDMLNYYKMAKQGRAYVFGSGNSQINPIHGKDLAEVCVNVLNSSELEVDVGGPETFSHRQIAELAFRVLDKEPKIISIPNWIKNIMLFGLRRFTSVKTYGKYEFFMTVLTTDMVGKNYGKERLSKFFREQVE